MKTKKIQLTTELLNSNEMLNLSGAVGGRTRTRTKSPKSKIRTRTIPEDGDDE